MWWRRVVLAVFLVGCTKSNPAAHCTDGTCSDPNYPFCDVSGAVAGEPGACIATACSANEFFECRGDTEVRCNADGTNYNLTACERGCDPNANGCRLCDPGQTACTNGQVATCDASGAAVVKETCPLGCFETEPRCREIDPSNGLATYFDMVPSPPDLNLELAEFKTNSGVVTDNGVPVTVPNFAVSATTGGVALRVFVANNVTITQAFANSLVNSFENSGPGFVLLAKGKIKIIGQLTAHPSAGGGASLPGCTGGTGLMMSNCTYSSSGGGGGGFATNGARGGSITNNSEPGGSAGIANGNEKLIPLRGGCPGGGVKDAASTYVFVQDGGGGGAIQLVSRVGIDIEGVVDVQGGHGGAEMFDQGPGQMLGGGGAGGAILLEAPTVSFGPNAQLTAKGGDGAEACSLSYVNCTKAGVGATQSTAATAGVDTACLNNGKPTAAGAGGGGLGRIRVNTRDGTYTKANSTVEDGAVSSGTVSTR